LNLPSFPVVSIEIRGYLSNPQIRPQITNLKTNRNKNLQQKTSIQKQKNKTKQNKTKQNKKKLSLVTYRSVNVIVNLDVFQIQLQLFLDIVHD
jgi:hypothetical protein